MTGEDYLKAEAATVAFRFGEEFGVTGMLAILLTMRNRVLAGEEWREVISAVGQKLPDTREPSFASILQMVDNVFEGTVVDTLTNGASNWEGRGQIVAMVGGLTLYK